MLVLAGYFVGKMLDWLVRVERTVEHVQLLLKYCQVPTVRTILYVQDWVLVVLYLLNHARVLYIEDTQYA